MLLLCNVGNNIRHALELVVLAALCVVPLPKNVCDREATVGGGGRPLWGWRRGVSAPPLCSTPRIAATLVRVGPFFWWRTVVPARRPVAPTTSAVAIVVVLWQRRWWSLWMVVSWVMVPVWGGWSSWRVGTRVGATALVGWLLLGARREVGGLV